MGEVELCRLATESSRYRVRQRDRAGSYAEYHEAVDYLPIERLLVERVSTIAENPGFVEQVRGRKGYGQAALTHG
jgi:hypothetical protein